VASLPQVAGVVSIQNSAILSANIGLATTGSVTCPPGHFAPTGSATNGTCINYSYPLLANNIIWQNAAFQVGVGALSPAYQQNVVTLYNATFTGTAGVSHGAAIATQTATGQCVTGSSYWDLGVRGDTGPTNHSGGTTLNPTWSILSSGGYSGGGTNLSTAPGFTTAYCDGSRTPPEAAGTPGSAGIGWNVPPGISDATVPNPIFNLTPVATVDEGNNWINLRWGPLTMVNPLTGVLLSNYAPTAGSDNIPVAGSPHPATDFFGNLRPEAGEGVTGHFDVGAIEVQAAAVTGTRGASVTGGPLAFGNVATGTSSQPMTLTLHDTGTIGLTGITVTPTAPFSRAAGAAGGTCTATLAGNAAGTTTCTIGIIFTPTALGNANGTVTITANQNGTPVAVTGSPVAVSGTGVAPVRAATLTPATRAYGTVARGSTTGPTQVFTYTNTGNVTLTGVGDGTLGGTNPTEFFIVQNATTCGPVQPGRAIAVVTLAPAGTCQVSVQFRPTTALAAGVVRNATISVSATGLGATTSTLNGTGNP
jgi:hypothetical protein